MKHLTVKQKKIITMIAAIIVLAILFFAISSKLGTVNTALIFISGLGLPMLFYFIRELTRTPTKDPTPDWAKERLALWDEQPVRYSEHLKDQQQTRNRKDGHYYEIKSYQLEVFENNIKALNEIIDNHTHQSLSSKAMINLTNRIKAIDMLLNEVKTVNPSRQYCCPELSDNVTPIVDQRRL